MTEMECDSPNPKYADFTVRRSSLSFLISGRNQVRFINILSKSANHCNLESFFSYDVLLDCYHSVTYQARCVLAMAYLFLFRSAFTESVKEQPTNPPHSGWGPLMGNADNCSFTAKQQGCRTRLSEWALTDRSGLELYLTYSKNDRTTQTSERVNPLDCNYGNFHFYKRPRKPMQYQQEAQLSSSTLDGFFSSFQIMHAVHIRDNKTHGTLSEVKEINFT